MSDMPTSFPFMRRALPWLITMIVALTIEFAGTFPAVAQTVYEDDDTVLEQIIIFGRHGVRSAALPDANLASFAVRPYPAFGVPTGFLTVRGRRNQVSLGGYYRSYLLQQGLLTGDDRKDARAAYFRSNSTQRSNISAAGLAEGLLPGAAVPVHSYPLGQPDPVFDSLASGIVTVDTNRAVREVAGSIGQGSAVASAYSTEFALIRSVLFDYPLGTTPAPPTPGGLVDPTAIPIPLTANTSNVVTGNVINAGGLLTTLFAADPFIMQYADGCPLNDVAWGELSIDQISQQSRIITKHLDIEVRPPYLNRIQSSNAVSHILRSMLQTVRRDRIPGAFSDANTNLLVINSSDAYVVGLAGLLNLHWQLPGYQADYVPPGGSLVFELRKTKRSSDKGRHSDAYIVRFWFTAQTLEQLRNVTALTLNNPPATMQLLIPGARTGRSSLDVGFERFASLLVSAIDRGAVEEPNTESPPGPLTGVPLE
jgi:4-phytase / acid phosphatase